MELSVYFQKSELIPAVVQDADTKTVLMLGYVNEEALRRTLATKTAWFYSRSRDKLWNKGESSGNFLYIEEVYADCDRDTLLYLARPAGPTCHTGKTSCFFEKIPTEDEGGI